MTTPVAGDPAGIRKFTGDWFDEEGNLVAVISNSPEPWLSVHTPYNLEPKDAHLRSGKIVFRLTSNDAEEVSLQLTGKDEIQVSVARDPHATCGDHRLLVLVLIRNPSPAWHRKLAARKAREEASNLARDAFYDTMDRLARVL